MSENGSLWRENVTACEKINLTFTHKFLPAVFVLVFLVGTISNIWGLKCVCKRWEKMGNINIFMLNLGIADLLYLFTLPFLVSYYALDQEWIFGVTFCKVTRFCFNLNLYGSIGFLTCISIYRYLGIIHPMTTRGKITSLHSMAISALVWFLVFIQILPDMFFDKAPKNSSAACFDTTVDQQIKYYLPYSVGWTITGFVIPLLIILACYGHIILALATQDKYNTSDNNAYLKQRCLKLAVLLTVLFSICFIPYHLFKNLNLKTRILKLDGKCNAAFDDIYIAHQIGRGLVSLNSAINPLIYLVGNDDFLLRCQRASRQARRSIAGWTSAVLYRKAMEAELSPGLHTTLNTELVF